MLTFAIIAILLIVFVLLFKRRPQSGTCLEVVQKGTSIFILDENANSFIRSYIKRKRSRMHIKLGAVF